MKAPKLTHLDEVLCKWFTAICSEGNPMTGTMIIEKRKSAYGEMKTTESWLQKLSSVG